MTLCPLCSSGTKRVELRDGDYEVRIFYCDSFVDRNGMYQSERCRVRQLERVLLEILPLAQQGSCEHDTEPPAENVCCQWRTVAVAIETLGIKAKEAAPAATS